MVYCILTLYIVIDCILYIVCGVRCRSVDMLRCMVCMVYFIAYADIVYCSVCRCVDILYINVLVEAMSTCRHTIY